MDFTFNVNELLKDEITCVDKRLQPCRQNGIDRHGFQKLHDMLFEIVDKMGDASAKAQGLHGSITTGRKLEMSDHRLYIMVDGNSTRGNGSVLGILKIGNKKLFVYDHTKAQHELEPLCILDFYVHESRQRMGCGRKLFDFMLRNERLPVHHLAIDRPSPKFLSFMSKHYNMRATIPQVNNFVIFEGFFNNRADGGTSRNRRRGGAGEFGMDQHSISAHRPPSGKRSTHVPHYDPNPSHAHINNHSREDQMSKNALGNWVVPSPGRQPQSHMGAGEMMYSRHRATPPGSYHGNSPTPSRGAVQQDTMSANPGLYYKKLNGLSSPYTYYNTGMSPGNLHPHLDIFQPKLTQGQGQIADAATNSAVTRDVASTPNFGNRTGVGVQGPTYPPKHSNNIVPLTGPVGDPRYPAEKSQATPPVPYNGTPTNQQAAQNVASPSSFNMAQRPPSGKRNQSNKRIDAANPPLLQREGPPTGYTQMFNLHQDYQGRNGHLSVPKGVPSHPLADLRSTNIGQVNSPYSNLASQNTSWTVTGALRDQRLNAPMASRYYNTNRLW